ncbi:MAG: autoinducer 2 ABC transporter substrate-binding protein, partial [Spirochaetaceae bacterium]|nr:autoinducer 2 ABC transporter substrate-binding protein [Spirochaetaceae bacterium]
DPGDAGFAMTWVALQLLEGKTIKDGMMVPGMGKVVINGDVIKVDAMIDITGDNADDFGF